MCGESRGEQKEHYRLMLLLFGVCVWKAWRDSVARENQTEN